MGEGKGEGFANIAGGIGSILGGLFGGDGLGNDIAAIQYASNNQIPAYGYYPPYRPANQIPWGLIILAIAGVAVAFLIIKK